MTSRSIKPEDIRRNLKRIELDEAGKLRAIEFEDCGIFLDEEHAQLLRSFVDNFNRPNPKPRIRKIEDVSA